MQVERERKPLRQRDEFIHRGAIVGRDGGIPGDIVDLSAARRLLPLAGIPRVVRYGQLHIEPPRIACAQLAAAIERLHAPDPVHADVAAHKPRPVCKLAREHLLPPARDVLPNL